jgi:hypothetical protein
LAGEARLEIALIEVAAPRPVVRALRATARKPRPEMPRPRLGRVVLASIGTMSLAAAWMLWLGASGASRSAAVDASDQTTAARFVASGDAGLLHDKLDGS